MYIQVCNADQTICEWVLASDLHPFALSLDDAKLLAIAITALFVTAFLWRKLREQV